MRIEDENARSAESIIIHVCSTRRTCNVKRGLFRNNTRSTCLLPSYIRKASNEPMRSCNGKHAVVLNITLTYHSSSKQEQSIARGPCVPSPRKHVRPELRYIQNTCTALPRRTAGGRAAPSRRARTSGSAFGPSRSTAVSSPKSKKRKKTRTS